MPDALAKDGADASIYPLICSHLSPTINNWVPLTAVCASRLRDYGQFVNGVVFSPLVCCGATNLLLGRRLYYYNNHPVRLVCLSGVIVAVDKYERWGIYTLDDSSGVVMQCVCRCPRPPADAARAGFPRPQPDTAGAGLPPRPSIMHPLVPWEALDVGVVIKVHGIPQMFRDEIQVRIIKIEILPCTEYEVEFWAQRQLFERSVLGAPWHLDARIVDKIKEHASYSRKRSKTDAIPPAS